MLSFNKWIGAVAFGQSLLCSTLGLLAGPDDPAKSLSVQHFSSPQTEGFIGVTDDAPIDNPADNIFHVQIDEPLCGEENVWLVYELDGVQDHTAVSRSVNDQVAVGGYLVRERHGWAVQRERLNAEWLKAGDNVIRFTLPEHAAHSYRIRNLRIEVDRSTVKQSTPQIVFNQSSDHYFFDKAYIKGFVSGAGYENVRIIVDGKEARMFNGEFETIVDFARAENTCSVEVEARHADGTTTCHSVVFSEPLTADYQYNIDQFTYRTEKYFDASKEGTVSLHGARLDHAVNALKENATLSITSLRAVDIPALDGGMVNVTKNHVGFRFLPHGTVFGKEVNVTLPFDAAAIPDGYTEKDIRTYYFDEQSHHWVAMTLDTVLIEKGEVVSKTLHFTDMINAIIKVPESPEVSAYNSTSMKGIKAANPTAGINLINPPQANNTGNASIGYPLNIPAGRAGMQPQLTISYNSGGGNGWMGLGWNLSLPMISIDTRWGVPRYDSLWETETYTMNGEQLTPVAHRGELRPRTNGGNEGVRFYPRVEGAFNKIVRHGDTPANYWWEVTDKNGTRYFYGGSPTGFEEDAVLRTREGSSTAYKGKVAQWFLREVRDLNGNTVRYHYAKIADAGVEGGTVKGHQMYIEKITYTGVNGGDGPYVVKFTRESGRPDKIIM
ncbi:MAG TPA: SpvB/TcaC N-terminal domain-containing protein, partial [Chryseosolibacter sp.]|nr:SpvB/TcaC N-terminal domain-containing protein [Chryseosolibacter sp.]